jgi:hypothetical protein
MDASTITANVVSPISVLQPSVERVAVNINSEVKMPEIKMETKITEASKINQVYNITKAPEATCDGCQ